MISIPTVQTHHYVGIVLGRLHQWSLQRSSSKRLVRVSGWLAWAAFLTALVCTSPAVEGQRIGCVTRFWVWQVWRRVVKRPIQAAFPDGSRMELPPWSELAGVTIATGLHEPAEELFVFALIRAGDVAIDVGANVGIYTIACAVRGARVAAFEPSSKARAALLRNIELNKLEDLVRIFPMALSDTTGAASFTTDLDVGNHLVGSDEGVGHVETVPVTTLDSIVLSDNGWFEERAPLLLKIDVEGNDEAVLEGARMVLERDRPVVLVETWHGGHSVRNFLTGLGYRVYRYHIGTQALSEYPSTWAGQANFIAVHDDVIATVRTRLTEFESSSRQRPKVRWWLSTS